MRRDGCCVESNLACPLCNLTLDGSRSATCPGCGLWWVGARSDREMLAAGTVSDESPVPLGLALRESVSLWWVVILLVFACFGYGAALMTILSVRQDPSSLPAWAALLVGLSLGGLVGTVCAASVIQLLLHAIIPARLEGDESRLRVRVWNTWDGLLSGFRRTDVMVPGNQIEGVAFLTGRGGDSQLFLLHSSGLTFGTGWSGTKADAMRISEPLVRWLAIGRERPSG